MPTGQRAAVARRREGAGRRGTELLQAGRGPIIRRRQDGRYREAMVLKVLAATGLRSSHLYAMSMGSVGLCIGLWIRAKTVDQQERGNAERRALFVGLWSPTLWLMGDSLERKE